MTSEERASERARGFNPFMTKFEDLQARKEHRSEFTVFLGGKAAAGVMAGVGANGEVKQGLYFTVDSRGEMKDAGAKIETSATAGTQIHVPVGKVAFGVEIAGPEASVSFVPDNGL
jgi:hypothetical protein